MATTLELQIMDMEQMECRTGSLVQKVASLFLSSKHVQMLCQWHFLLIKTTLYDDSLKKALDDKHAYA